MCSRCKQWTPKFVDGKDGVQRYTGECLLDNKERHWMDGCGDRYEVKEATKND